jgi:hypothetical protein
LTISSYSQVPSCIFPKLDPNISTLQCQLPDPVFKKKSEYDWLKKVMNSAENELDSINIMWAAHHAEVSIQESQPMPISAMLPIVTVTASRSEGVAKPTAGRHNIWR